MTDIAPLVAELRELLAEDEAARAEGQKRGVMPAYHGRSVTAEARLLRGVRAALPTLLDALTNSAGSEEGDTKESYWLDEVLRRNGPCPTCGTIGMLGTVEDKLATPSGSGTDEEVERVAGAIFDKMRDLFDQDETPFAELTEAEKQDCRSVARAAIAALSARSGEVALREALIDCAAHLNAAISLLDRAPATVAPSKKMFEQMKKDYRASLRRARAVLGEGR